MPISVLLIPFFIFILAFLMFSFSAFYHVIRFELLNFTSIAMTIIFVAGSIIIVTTSATYMKDIDWQERIEFSIADSFAPQQQNSNDDEINVLTF